MEKESHPRQNLAAVFSHLRRVPIAVPKVRNIYLFSFRLFRCHFGHFPFRFMFKFCLRCFFFFFSVFGFYCFVITCRYLIIRHIFAPSPDVRPCVRSTKMKPFAFLISVSQWSVHISVEHLSVCAFHSYSSRVVATAVIVVSFIVLCLSLMLASSALIIIYFYLFH